MRTWLAALTVLGVLAGSIVPAVGGDVFVPGHLRSDGTYVKPHMRSAPDSSYNNNWSTSPNVNPYTGQQGHNQPKLFDYNSGSTPGAGSNFYGTGQGLGGTRQPRGLYGR